MISEKLREIREGTGMNKKEFSEYLNLKYTTYNNYETGAREPASDFLILISEKFGVSVDYLLGQKEDSEIVPSFNLNLSEWQHIQKYRTLDVYGKKQVDSVLSNEVERVKEQSLEIAEESVPYMFAKTEYLTGLSAGTGLFVFDDIPTQVIEVPERYKNADFVIGVTGNSMEPKFYDGDKVAVQKTNTISIGDIGVFMHEGNGYIKELGHDKLISLNKECSNIDINETTKCIGKVLGKI